ncbi:DDE-type integrase/transposase/recombinase [Streptomyces sp. NPDC007896]|uniref:DDE-type integrase/transposase/recombinase n=1 Tax=Streptomyces sp. NPDC007896 TaxID=3364784 RepID=UPI0036E87897
MRQVRAGSTQTRREIFTRINGKLKFLWRAIDQHRTVQNRRDKTAAERFFRGLLKKTRTVRPGGRRRRAPLLRRGPPRGSCPPSSTALTRA